MRTSLRKMNVSAESTLSIGAPSRQLANGNFEYVETLVAVYVHSLRDTDATTRARIRRSADISGM